MPGAVRGVTGPPFGGTPEISGCDQAFSLLRLYFIVLLAGLVISALSRDHPVPRDTPVGHLSDGEGGGFGEKAGHFLIATPVRPFDRLGNMDIRAVPVAHAAVAQGGLHSTLGCCRMRTPGRDHAQADGLKTAGGGLHGHPFAGQAGSYGQQIGIKGFQRVLPNQKLLIVQN
jgi:hypothetical protein